MSKIHAGKTNALLLKAKSKFKRKSRREQWMVFGARLVHHRQHMLEFWSLLDEDERSSLEMLVETVLENNREMNKGSDSANCLQLLPSHEVKHLICLPDMATETEKVNVYRACENMQELFCGIQEVM